jgi:hypothetical protein
LKLSANPRNYPDVSDDEQQVPDDESHPSENELSDQEEDEGGRDDDKTDVEFDDAVSEKPGGQSTTEYEDISDVERRPWTQSDDNSSPNPLA